MTEVDVKNVMLYAQRQEQILHEFIRRTIDAEVKVSSFSSSIEEMKNKYESSQSEVVKQNELMQQATKSIENLTIKNKNLEQQIENLQKNYTECNKTREELKNENQNIKSTNYGLQKEIERLNIEIKNIIEENKNTKNINKKKAVNTAENDF